MLLWGESNAMWRRVLCNESGDLDTGVEKAAVIGAANSSNEAQQANLMVNQHCSGSCTTINEGEGLRVLCNDEKMQPMQSDVSCDL